MATLLRNRAQAAASGLKLATPSSIAIAGHSLGAALAILYAAENALVHRSTILRYARSLHQRSEIRTL